MEENGVKYIMHVEDEVPAVSKWDVFKCAASMAASGCATVAVSRYLKANMPAGGNLLEKAVLGVGVYFITGVVGAKVAEYCEDELEQFKALGEQAREIEEAEDERD